MIPTWMDMAMLGLSSQPTLDTALLGLPTTAQRMEGIDLIAIERQFANGNRLFSRPTVPLRRQWRQAIDGAALFQFLRLRGALYGSVAGKFQLHLLVEIGHIGTERGKGPEEVKEL